MRSLLAAVLFLASTIPALAVPTSVVDYYRLLPDKALVPGGHLPSGYRELLLKQSKVDVAGGRVYVVARGGQPEVHIVLFPRQGSSPLVAVSQGGGHDRVFTSQLFFYQLVDGKLTPQPLPAGPDPTWVYTLPTKGPIIRVSQQGHPVSKWTWNGKSFTVMSLVKTPPSKATKPH